MCIIVWYTDGTNEVDPIHLFPPFVVLSQRFCLSPPAIGIMSETEPLLLQDKWEPCAGGVPFF